MMETTNPYQSPLASSVAGTRPPLPVRGRWLIFVSLVLAVLIEVLPTEADILVAAYRDSDISLFLATKVICLAVILFPLATYVSLNGWRGVKDEKGRIIAIAIIVLLNIAGWLVTYFLLDK
jgi:uncharacterized membrane protein YozB (DUF420 family)